MTKIRNFLQHFQGQIGVHDDLFAACRHFDQFQHLKLADFPGAALDPGIVFLRSTGNKGLPGGHLLSIAQIGLQNRISHRPHFVDTVVFAVVNHAVLLRQHGTHGGLACIGRTGDEITVAEIMLEDIVFDMHLISLLTGEILRLMAQDDRYKRRDCYAASFA